MLRRPGCSIKLEFASRHNEECLQCQGSRIIARSSTRGCGAALSVNLAYLPTVLPMLLIKSITPLSLCMFDSFKSNGTAALVAFFLFLLFRYFHLFLFSHVSRNMVQWELTCWRKAGDDSQRLSTSLGMVSLSSAI